MTVHVPAEGGDLLALVIHHVEEAAETLHVEEAGVKAACSPAGVPGH